MKNGVINPVLFVSGVIPILSVHALANAALPSGVFSKDIKEFFLAACGATASSVDLLQEVIAKPAISRMILKFNVLFIFDKI